MYIHNIWLSWVGTDSIAGQMDGPEKKLEVSGFEMFIIGNER